MLQCYETTFAMMAVELGDAVAALADGAADFAARAIAAAQRALNDAKPLWSLVATMQPEAFLRFREFTEGASAIQSAQLQGRREPVPAAGGGAPGFPRLPRRARCAGARAQRPGDHRRDAHPRPRRGLAHCRQDDGRPLRDARVRGRASEVASSPTTGSRSRCSASAAGPATPKACRIWGRSARCPCSPPRDARRAKRRGPHGSSWGHEAGVTAGTGGWVRSRAANDHSRGGG